MNIVEPIREPNDIKNISNYLKKEKDKKYYIIWKIGITSGLRVSDILNLDISDVKGKTEIVIREQKTNKYKKFPLNAEVREEIENYIAGLDDREDESPLFVGRDKRLCRSQVYRVINEAVDYLGIDIPVGTHTMRKTFGYHHYRQFKNIVLLQAILNHSSPAITLRYIGITQDEINKSYNLLTFSGNRKGKEPETDPKTNKKILTEFRRMNERLDKILHLFLEYATKRERI